MLMREGVSMRKRLLAMAAAVGLILAMALPAMAVTETLTCGREEHVHGEDCYARELVCGFDEEPAAAEEDQMGDVPAEETPEAHVHTEDCYAEQPILTCGDTSEGHEHTESCYNGVERVLVCGMEEGVPEENEEEGDEPQNEELPEKAHVHTEDCYLQVLVCQKEEHVHTAECYMAREDEEDWTADLRDLELTGSYPEDVLAVARTQLGYAERADGYTRYGDWYGIPTGDWCAMFLSFCLHYAKVPTMAFPQAAGCETWIALLSDGQFGLYAEKDAYTPAVGDFVFFDWDGDGAADHVGVLEERDDAGFTVIEGNSSDKVQRVEYLFSDPSLLGYGQLSAAGGGMVCYAQRQTVKILQPVKNIDVTKLDGETYAIVTGGQADGLHKPFIDQAETGTTGNMKANILLLANRKPAEEDVIWTFQAVNASAGQYRIHADGKYLKLAKDGITLVDHEADASVLTCERLSNDPSRIMIYDPNIYDGDQAKPQRIAERVGAGYVFTWDHGAAGEAQYLYELADFEYDTFESAEPSKSTQINLFDYWSTETQKEENGNFVNDAGFHDQGINEGHNLKFVYGDDHGSTPAYACNLNRGSTGVVRNTLGTDGYPVLSGTAVTGGSSESLAYLFNPDLPVENGKQSFKNVTGLLYSEGGYYTYDSTQHFAELDAEGKKIVLYDKPGVVDWSSSSNIGQFFPMNSYVESHDSPSNTAGLNHHFGMTLTTRFIQQFGGYVSQGSEMPITFEFSGDDDVWIFVDDVLVADLGGVHSRIGVQIDFSNGQITYRDAQDTPSDEVGKGAPRSLEAAFAAAGKTPHSGWQTVRRDIGGTMQNCKVFTNGSTHTLKFFYMERGNYDSNLRLKFNLTEIPVTSLYKVNQNGDTVSGAKFAIYPANADYQHTVGPVVYEEVQLADGSFAERVRSGDPTKTLEHTGNPDPETGVIDAKGGGKVIPAYVGVTDENGEMVFVDSENADMVYSQSDLESMFGTHFILREIGVPDGYRTVRDVIRLRFDHGVMVCDNTHDTGVWAATNNLVTATHDLYTAREYSRTIEANNDLKAQAEPVDGEEGYYKIPYVSRNEATGELETNGTLFAVILKRDQRNYKAGYHYSYWFPIYGTDIGGYKVVRDNVPDEPEDYNTLTSDNCETNVKAVIEAAKGQREITGGNLFAINEQKTDAQLLLEHMPGHIDTYFTFQRDAVGRVKDDPTPGELQYVVGYFWTSADDLDGATEENTVRVYANFAKGSGLGEDTGEYSAFNTQWGTTIEVPNINNRMGFQKLNSKTEPVRGAAFALYNVFEGTVSDSVDLPTEGGFVPDPDGQLSAKIPRLYYVADQTREDGTPVRIYLEPDEDLDNQGRAWIRDDALADAGKQPTEFTATYRIDTDGTANPFNGTVTGENYGTIFVTMDDGTAEYTISPAKNAEGVTCCSATMLPDANIDIDATNYFNYLKNGRYVLREISAPEPYLINTTETMVCVTDDGIFANAGLAGDGVDVGNGLGYLSKTLQSFARQDSVDETLSWLYSVLLVNRRDQSFEAVEESLDLDEVETTIRDSKWVYVTDQNESSTMPGFGTGTTSDRREALVTYLQYLPDKVLTKDDPDIKDLPDYFYNYAANEDQSPRNNTKAGEGTIRLFTHQGWSALAVYQDYEYGYLRHEKLGKTRYDDLGNKNLKYLFSGFTMVRVTDPTKGELVVSKTVSGFEGEKDREFPFTVTLSGVSENGVPAESINGFYGDMEFTNGKAAFRLKHDTELRAQNLPVGLGYTVTETDFGHDDPDGGYQVNVTQTVYTFAGEKTEGPVISNVTETGGTVAALCPGRIRSPGWNIRTAKAM